VFIVPGISIESCVPLRADDYNDIPRTDMEFLTMAEAGADEHKLYLAERELLIDAARESARTFDKAVLAFGSAVFGFSIAFLKDIAPKPAPETLKWLGASWLLFSLGLLAILLSFLFSHRACMFEIEVGGEALSDRGYKRKKNPWSIATNWCNIFCIAFLFVGLLSWSIFAFDNLSLGDNSVSKVEQPADRRGYVPPPPPAKAPSPQQTPAPPPAEPVTKPAPTK
jgi:hypothetical protein